MPISSSCEAEWTDPTLTTNTKVRSIHIQELRQVLNRERTDRDMQTVSFTDPSLDTTTKIKMIHIEELRQAIEQTPKFTVCDSYHFSVHSHENQTDEGSEYQNHHHGEHSDHQATFFDTYHHEFRHCDTHDSGYHHTYNYNDDGARYSTHDVHAKGTFKCGDHHPVNVTQRSSIESGHNYLAKLSQHTGQQISQNDGQRQAVDGTYCSSFDDPHQQPWAVGTHYDIQINYSTGEITSTNCSSFYSQIHGQVTRTVAGDINCNMQLYARRTAYFESVDMNVKTSFDTVDKTSDRDQDRGTENSMYASDHDINVGQYCYSECSNVKKFVFTYDKGANVGSDYSSQNWFRHGSLYCNQEPPGAGSPGYGTGLGRCD